MTITDNRPAIATVPALLKFGEGEPPAARLLNALLFASTDMPGLVWTS